MNPVNPLTLGDIAIGGGSPFVLIAGPCVIESEQHATDLAGAPRRHRAARARAVHLQGVLRQGEPHVGPLVPGPGLDEGLRVLAAIKARFRVPILTDIHEPSHAARGGRRRRRPADSGVPLPPDRPARRGREDRPHRQHQERAVPRARRHEARRGESRGRRQPARDRHRARHELRLSQPDRRHARVSDDARAGRAGGLRRHAQPAAAGRRRRRHRRPGRIHRAARVGRRRRGRRRRVSRGARRPVAREERRAERAAPRQARAAAPAPDGDRRDRQSRRPRPARGRRGRMADRALARKVLETEAAAILALVDRLDARFDRAVQLLRQCKGRVILTGMGKSGIICRKIAATLTQHRHAAFFLHPAEAIHGDLGVIQGDDVVVALSYSGETDELLRLLETIRRLGAKLIAITGGPKSTLAQAADVALDCSVAEEACPMNLVPTASTTGGARHRRRARDDAARREGLPAGGLREPASRRQARQAPDARRSADARRQALPDRARRHADARRHLRDVEQGPRHDLRRRRRRRRCSASSPTATCGATWSAAARSSI